MDEVFHIRLGTPEGTLDLGMVESLAEHLRGAFRELAREAGAEGKIEVRFRVRDVRKGSLILDLDPELIGVGTPEAGEVVSTLISDINSLAQESPRSTMGTGLLQQYRALVGVAQKAGGLQVQYRTTETTIGPEQEFAFRVALRERPEVDALVVGTIESVNIHVKPWRFGLYTKSDRERVECHFPDEMLDSVLTLMEKKTLVEVSGEAMFGPVGVTPRLLSLQRLPEELTFDPVALLAFRRSARITSAGESAAEAVARLREETAVFG